MKVITCCILSLITLLPAAPGVVSVSAVNVGATAANIAVTTTEPALAAVLCNGTSTQGAGYYSSQSIRVSGLNPDVRYEYSVRVEDESGGADTAGPYFFTTQDSIMPSSYTIPPKGGFSLVMDGSTGEWPEILFLDSIQGDENVYFRTNSTLWNRNEMQFQVSAAYDADFVYLAVKVVSDDRSRIGNLPGSFDNLKVNVPGASEMYVQIMSGGSIIYGASSPFRGGGSAAFTGSAAVSGNPSLPSYECRMARSILDPFNTGDFQLSVEMNDEDTLNGLNSCYLAVGAAYTGAKQSTSMQPWNNPLYFPEFHLGSGIKNEAPIRRNMTDGMDLSVYPNPVSGMSAVQCRFRTSESGVLSLFDVSGRMVVSSAVNGRGNHVRDVSGLAAGVYLARLTAGKRVLQERIAVIR